MENGRDDRIRRRALALWEQAGQRGVYQDYWDFAASEIDAEFEDAPRVPERTPLPLVP
jgi:hypothetical protein